ncbi:hypothetical protein [Aeromicrobium sp.]|uniref:hypothetical protein n=1 Tax=Aeromicrobium sp. TaxID=1871063 RepID=UPI002FCB9819
MSPISDWDTPGAVFTGADSTALLVVFVVLGMLALIGFMARMLQHENHAYAQMINHEPVERGPAAEGEPPVY